MVRSGRARPGLHGLTTNGHHSLQLPARAWGLPSSPGPPAAPGGLPPPQTPAAVASSAPKAPFGGGG
eukprot:9366836-Alexandrium_andersonii.AAC.1